jgi:hypothetical protein
MIIAATTLLTAAPTQQANERPSIEINEGLATFCQYPLVGSTESEQRRFEVEHGSTDDPEAIGPAAAGMACAGFIAGVRQMLNAMNELAGGEDNPSRPHCAPD